MLKDWECELRELATEFLHGPIIDTGSNFQGFSKDGSVKTNCG
jgi:hypothetical protein